MGLQTKNFIAKEIWVKTKRIGHLIKQKKTFAVKISDKDLIHRAYKQNNAQQQQQAIKNREEINSHFLKKKD